MVTAPHAVLENVWLLIATISYGTKCKTTWWLQIFHVDKFISLIQETHTHTCCIEDKKTCPFLLQKFRCHCIFFIFQTFVPDIFWQNNLSYDYRQTQIKYYFLVNNSHQPWIPLHNIPLLCKTYITQLIKSCYVVTWIFFLLF